MNSSFNLSSETLSNVQGFFVADIATLANFGDHVLHGDFRHGWSPAATAFLGLGLHWPTGHFDLALVGHSVLFNHCGADQLPEFRHRACFDEL